MIKFEKKFLYTFADVEEAKKLIGIKGLFVNTYINMNDLKRGELQELTGVLNVNVKRFKNERNEYWQFFYCDPHLECKRAFYLEGKEIQREAVTGDWIDELEPEWYDNYKYRIKPETKTRLTNREVAEWLAKGNGQIRFDDGDLGKEEHFYSGISYPWCCDDYSCFGKIRKWSDREWHEPTREYIEGN